MNIEKAAQNAENAWKTFKKSDPVMVRKSFSMKDTAYRKSTPGREVWHAEVSFEQDFYLALLILAAAGIISFVAVRRMWRSCCHRKA